MNLNNPPFSLLFLLFESVVVVIRKMKGKHSRNKMNKMIARIMWEFVLVLFVE